MELLLTGGSACGKSSLAEKILQKADGDRFYIATMIPYGEDGKAKVERHIKLREGKNFKTIEKYLNINEIELPPDSSVLLECICNLTANEMFERDGAADDAISAVLDGVEHIRGHAKNTIVITNEVGNDGGIYDKPVLKYIRNMGVINSTLTERFSNVYEMCCGIPIKIKGELQWKF